MRTTLRTLVIVALVVYMLPLAAEAQNRDKKKQKKNKNKQADSNVVALYRQGNYEEAAAAAEALRTADRAKVEDLYVAGLAFETASDKGKAQQVYDKLAAASTEEDAWHWLGKSASALIGGDVETAANAAERAVELEPGNKYVHYQRGLVKSNQRDYQQAAESLTRTLEIDGAFAYGHYYAGLAYYQLRSMVAASNHFERFLELAPEAPEHVQVEGILAALRGS